MATPHISTPSPRPQSPFPPILYTSAQVALMVAIASRTRSEMKALAASTGEAVLDLTSMGRGEMPPTAAVLRFFDLRRDGQGYAWHLQWSSRLYPARIPQQ